VLLSILLAALLWVYVANLENPDRTTVYTNLPVEVRGLAANLKVISPPPEVSVTIDAPQSVLATLSRADVRAFVDLNGYTRGVHLMALQAEVRGDIRERGGTVTFSPNAVEVQIEEEVTRIFPVEVRLIGTPAFGYGVEPARTNPATLTLMGAADAIARVTNVVVTVDVEGKTGTQQGTRPPAARDQAGDQVLGISFDPPSVEVVVPIELLQYHRVVPVRVPVPGQPASGFRVSAISYDPTNVTVCCKPEVLDPLQFIDTQPVNINGATTTVLTQTELILPAEVELYPGQPRTISVTVSVEAMVTTLQVSVAPGVEGEQEGTGVVLSPERLDLVLAGTFDQLQALKPSDVRAIVNLQDRGPGTYSIRPQVVVPPGVTLQSSAPETLSVTVIAPTPEPSPSATPIPTATPPPPPTPQPTSEAPTATVPAPPTATRTTTPLPTIPARTSTSVVSQTPSSPAQNPSPTPAP
jgi:YbbR domain-containing protein